MLTGVMVCVMNLFVLSQATVLFEFILRSRLISAFCEIPAIEVKIKIDRHEMEVISNR